MAAPDDGRTELHAAAHENDAALVDRLLDEGADVDAQDSGGFTPLHFAAEYSSVEAARRLLDRGAKVDVTNMHGNTPLFSAVFNSKGQGELIKLLLEHGADPEKENKHGQSPRGLANLIGDHDVAQFFGDPEPR